MRHDLTFEDIEMLIQLVIADQDPLPFILLTDLFLSHKLSPEYVAGDQLVHQGLHRPWMMVVH